MAGNDEVILEELRRLRAGTARLRRILVAILLLVIALIVAGFGVSMLWALVWTALAAGLVALAVVMLGSHFYKGAKDTLKSGSPVENR